MSKELRFILLKEDEDAGMTHHEEGAEIHSPEDGDTEYDLP